jgi:endonuclease-3 related protein
MISENMSYEEVQRLFMMHLPMDEKLFNEYHALLVHLGKTLCKKVPRCDICPLKTIGSKERGERRKVNLSH